MIEVLNWVGEHAGLTVVLAIIAGVTLCGVAEGLGNIGRRRP
jgi:hypothetical protein